MPVQAVYKNEEIAEIKLAETWVGENGFGSDCNNINSVDANREMVNAFLAGLKADKPRWYKITDGDLPKENELYLAATSEGGLIISYFNGAYWETRYDISNVGHAVDFVVAWCEIPKFSE